MNELPLRIAKELVHLNSWFTHAAILVAQGRENYFREPLSQHSADAILAKIGEAARRLEKLGWATQRPGIPWAEIIGNRNHVVHGYDVINRERQWVTLTTSVPALAEDLRSDLTAAQRVINSQDSALPRHVDPPWQPPEENLLSGTVHPG